MDQTIKEERISFGKQNKCTGLLTKLSKKGILLYSGFYGDENESHGLFANYVPMLHENNFSTLRYNATGTGKDNMPLSKTACQIWQENSSDALSTLYEAGIERIGIIGFSLGATYAIKNCLYSKNKSKIKAISLWAPAFDPQKDMLQRYIDNGDYKSAQEGTLIKQPNNKIVSSEVLDSLGFNVIDEAKKVKQQKDICHSEKDSCIPITTSEALGKELQNLEGLHKIKNSGHSFRPLGENVSPHSLPRDIVYNITLGLFDKYL